MRESAMVDGGRIDKARACVVINNSSELYSREAAESCWDKSAKLPFIFMTSGTQTICNMNNSGTKYQNVLIFMIKF